MMQWQIQPNPAGLALIQMKKLFSLIWSFIELVLQEKLDRLAMQGLKVEKLERNQWNDLIVVFPKYVAAGEMSYKLLLLCSSSPGSSCRTCFQLRFQEVIQVLCSL